MKSAKRSFTKDVKLYEISRSSDGYVEGHALLPYKTFYFEIKRYNEASGYGIGKGRISKLIIEKKHGDTNVYIHYDRKWCRHWRNVPSDFRAVYRAIIERYN